jgi:4-azaleucine resistance transporter AzlC
MHEIPKSKWELFKSGLKAAWPICLGYIPLGLATGVIGAQAGLSPLEVGLISLLVFAGSGQIIAFSMLGAGAGILSITLTTLVVNLRHFLMSSALSMHLSHQPRRPLSLYAHCITDETFAVNLARFRTGSWDVRQALVVNHTSHLFWIGSNVAGCLAGASIPEGAFGIDYALAAMFIGLLVLQLRGIKYAVTAVLAAILAVVFSIWLPGNLYIVAASALAATLYVIFNYRVKKINGDV